MTEYWDPHRYGCIARDSFTLRPSSRIELTKGGDPLVRSKKGDVRAPIVAGFSTTQSFAQYTAFTQWYRFDLAGGARPFLIDLWMWGKVRRVRARFTGAWKAKRAAFDSWQMQCSFEIERESIA